jgi:CBS domain containing-hemolysin-like protein
MKLRHKAAKGSRGAQLALNMLKKPEWLLSTTLVGTNIAVVTNTTMATALMIQLFGERGSWLAVVLVAPLIWVFGEIVPKSIFQQRADTITPTVIYPLKLASYLFSPLLVGFALLTRLMTRLFGRSDENPFTLREQIITMLHMPAQKGDIDPLENTMIRRMFSFSESVVEQTMVPLIDVVAVESGMTCREAVQVATEHNHVRLPVYEERIDKVVGVLHALDVLGLDLDRPIETHVRAARFVPGSKSNKELLLELRNDGSELAVVVDEFGGAKGIVTIEDIMEEVVEDIEDEYDTGDPTAQWLRKISEREYLVSARIELERLQEKLGFSIGQGTHATLAGFLLSKSGEIPNPGTVIEIDNVRFVIKRATPQAIQEVRIRW